MSKIIGLTGGIGSGKSTVAKYIASKGIPVYIADYEAKMLMEDPLVIEEVQQLFDENVILENGKLDRGKIGEIVFNNKYKLDQLNGVIHPKVKQHFTKWLQKHKEFPFVVKEVAILFESGGDKECDKVILVTAPLQVRLKRTMERDNISEELVLARMNNQMSEEDKILKSDFVVHNLSLEETYLSVDSILKNLNNS
ncbi:dephospho-CoA kinase [Flavobacterium chuncheonense]|uniref:Dephospho-CoA kinase n=1 Tax=Flavobacterium chuncheonense TaxID=2026653 RepID=A0ABW5YL08_9FLAO